MRMIALLFAAAVAIAGAPAGAATLTHAYDFSGSTVADSVGGSNGALINGATVSGGQLHLDGMDDYVEFGGDLVPVGSGDFSIFVRLQATPTPGNYTEVFSQGGSLYFGTQPNGTMRFGDTFLNTSVVYPSGTDYHNLLLTVGTGGTDFYIDGASAFHSDTAISYGPGTPTRFGRQYGGNQEYLQAQYDTVKIYSGIATYAEASESGVSAAPEPESWALMIGGFAGAGALLRRGRRAAAAPERRPLVEGPPTRKCSPGGAKSAPREDHHENSARTLAGGFRGRAHRHDRGRRTGALRRAAHRVRPARPDGLLVELHPHAHDPQA